MNLNPNPFTILDDVLFFIIHSDFCNNANPARYIHDAFEHKKYKIPYHDFLKVLEKAVFKQ